MVIVTFPPLIPSRTFLASFLPLSGQQLPGFCFNLGWEKVEIIVNDDVDLKSLQSLPLIPLLCIEGVLYLLASRRRAISSLAQPI